MFLYCYYRYYTLLQTSLQLQLQLLLLGPLQRLPSLYHFYYHFQYRCFITTTIIQTTFTISVTILFRLTITVIATIAIIIPTRNANEKAVSDKAEDRILTCRLYCERPDRESFQGARARKWKDDSFYRYSRHIPQKLNASFPLFFFFFLFSFPPHSSTTRFSFLSLSLAYLYFFLTPNPHPTPNPSRFLYPGVSHYAFSSFTQQLSLPRFSSL